MKLERFMAAALCGAALTASSPAAAELVREGAWPKDEPRVTLSLARQTRATALRQLAEKAGWNVVYRGPDGAPVDIHVKDAPAGVVLDALLGDGRYAGRFEGGVLSIAVAAPSSSAAAAPLQAPVYPEPPATAKTPRAPEPPTPPAAVASAASPTPPAPVASAAAPEPPLPPAEDMTVTGEDAVVAENARVRDLVVMGGRAEVRGHVTRDLAVVGGSVVLHPSARVDGDTSVTGGDLIVVEGARTGGDVGVVGGRVRHVAKADQVPAAAEDDGSENETTSEGESMNHMIHDASQALTHSAMLFIFGTVLLALLTRRMEALQVEVAARPMRSFALGIVGGIGAIAILVALCVTVIGIPVAVVALFALIFAAYGGICAVLTTLGGCLVRHRSDNPYVHLAVGCAVFLVVGALPFIGGLASLTVLSLGLGAIVATRGAGLVELRRPAAGPYR